MQIMVIRKYIKQLVYKKWFGHFPLFTNLSLNGAVAQKNFPHEWQYAWCFGI